MMTRQRSGPGRAAVAHASAAAWGVIAIGLGFASIDGTAALIVAVTGAACIALACVGFLAASWLLSVFGGLLATSLGAIITGVAVSSGAMVAAGLVGLIIAATGAVIAWQIDALRAALVAGSSPMPAGTDRTVQILQQIHDHVLLSDTAKRVLFRDRELHLLRHAIEEQIATGDYDVAATLCDDMAELFGRREEAEQFRERIHHVRQEHDEARIMASVARLDESLTIRDWAQAHQEAARLKRLYPDSHLIQGVDERIARARADHKHDLVRHFLDAAERDDTEAAMRLLRELDRYMTRQEAERLSSVAERVVTRRRESLGQEFKLAVNQHRWTDAVRLGESIVSEFPRSRMSQEVLAMIDTIRTRAGATAVATEPPG